MVSVQSIPSPAIHAEERAHEADHPSSLVAMFGADQPLKLDCGIDLVAVPDRLPDLWRAQCRALQRDSDFPCADRRSACRQRAPGDRQAGLVGNHGRSRPSARYRQIFHHLLERDRRLHGLDRAGLDQSRHRQIVGAGFSGHHHSRHGARADHADRSPRDRDAVLRGRRLDGRHAGAAMDRGLSQARVLGAGGGVQHAAFGAEHRVPRTRPPGRDGRSGLAPRPLFRSKAPIRIAASASRGWPRISPICRTPPCIASSAGGCRTASCRRSRSMPISRSRAICAIRARPLSSASMPTAISI